MNENFLKISHLTKSVKQTEVDQDDIEQHLTSDNKISPRQSSQISENFNVQVRRISFSTILTVIEQQWTIYYWLYYKAYIGEG